MKCRTLQENARKYHSCNKSDSLFVFCFLFLAQMVQIRHFEDFRCAMHCKFIAYLKNIILRATFMYCLPYLFRTLPPVASNRAWETCFAESGKIRPPSPWNSARQAVCGPKTRLLYLSELAFWVSHRRVSQAALAQLPCANEVGEL